MEDNLMIAAMKRLNKRLKQINEQDREDSSVYIEHDIIPYPKNPTGHGKL